MEGVRFRYFIFSFLLWIFMGCGLRVVCLFMRLCLMTMDIKMDWGGGGGGGGSELVSWFKEVIYKWTRGHIICEQIEQIIELY